MKFLDKLQSLMVAHRARENYKKGALADTRAAMSKKTLESAIQNKGWPDIVSAAAAKGDTHVAVGFLVVEEDVNTLVSHIETHGLMAYKMDTKEHDFPIIVIDWKQRQYAD